jgi:hypothetical protein
VPQPSEEREREREVALLALKEMLAQFPVDFSTGAFSWGSRRWRRAQAGATKSFPTALDHTHSPPRFGDLTKPGSSPRGGRSGQRACPHAQLGTPETAHGPTLESTSCLTVAPLTHSPTHSPPRLNTVATGSADVMMLPSLLMLI